MIVGRDLAIAGFDGIADSAHANPPLTTLEQPIYTIARPLANMILTKAVGKTLENKQKNSAPIIDPFFNGWLISLILNWLDLFL